MKKLVATVVAVVAVASLVFASVASAYLYTSTARQHTLSLVRSDCNQSSACRYYGVAQCQRISANRVDCRGFEENVTAAQGKYTCTAWFDWSQTYSGLRYHVEPTHCVRGWVY